VSYYLSLLPPRVRRGARSRLTLLSLGQPGGPALGQKLLARSPALDRIRRTIPDPGASYLVPYNTTACERDVAVALGIPMYGADPALAYLGTKSGCRELFADAGVPHPAGIEGLASAAEAVDAIIGLRASNPRLGRVVIKLNQGVSGEGNALVALSGLPAPGASDERAEVARRVAELRPEAPGVTATAFLDKLRAQGGVVEEWITGRDLCSPSVQLQITPLGEAQVVSTHDQILGGASGQSYLGCRFPAHPSYAPAISALARRVGSRLAQLGVIGRCALDFVVARDERDRWQPYAIELNLRKGGTTHPYETLAQLTGGSYDASTATYTSRVGRPKHYVATDHLEAPALKALGRNGVLALARRAELRFNPLLGTGAVFHMLSSVDELGRVGYTAIADTAEAAGALSERVESMLLDQARRAIATRAVAA
jgi:hypothetical protein